MNTDLIVELAPHYVAMLVIVFASLAVVRAAVGDLGLVPELGLALVVVFLYPFVVRRLGYAPSVWEE